MIIKNGSLISVVTGVVMAGACAVNSAEAADKPNIIYLMADDMRYDSMSYFGRTDLKTPNLDKLASDGFVFQRAYATTSICMASRAQVMTGNYEFTTGCNFDHGDEKLTHAKWMKAYPALLKANGYSTGFAGKFGFHVKEADGGKGSSETDGQQPDVYHRWE